MNNRLEGICYASSLVEQIDQQIKRVRWTSEKIDRKFAKRSGKEILEEGETFYMNPCLDLTLATAALMRRDTINYQMAIEEHDKTEKMPFNHVHFALEFSDRTGSYFINFKTMEIVQIGRENYLGRPDIPQVQLFRIDGSKIDPAKSLSQNLGFTSIEETLRKLFHGYQITPHIEKLKRDNTPKKFEEYEKETSKNLKVIIV